MGLTNKIIKLLGGYTKKELELQKSKAIRNGYMRGSKRIMEDIVASTDFRKRRAILRLDCLVSEDIPKGAKIEIDLKKQVIRHWR